MPEPGRIKYLGPAVVSVVAIAAGLLAVRQFHLSVDSFTYSVMANQIRDGKGLRYPVFRLDAEPDPDGTVPFTQDPPLLPALLAAMGGISSHRTWPAQLLNVICHLATVVTCFGVARRWGSTAAAILAALAVALSYSLLAVTHCLWTEPLFIALMIGSVALLVRSRSSPGRTFSLLGASLAAAAAFATRFAGAAMIVPLAWEVGRSWRRQGLASAMRTFAAALLIPLTCVGAFFVRNLMLTGAIRGWASAPPERGPSRFFKGLLGMLARNFWDVKHARLLLVIALLLIAGVAILVRILRLKPLSSGREGEGGRGREGDVSPTRPPFDRLRAVSEVEPLAPSPARSPALVRPPGGTGKALSETGMDIPLVAAVGYLGLVCAAMIRYQPSFEPRFAAPLTPLLLIVGVVVLDRVCRAFRAAWPDRFFSAALMAAPAAVVVLLSLPGLAFLASPTPPPVAVQTATVDWVTGHCPPGTRLAGNGASQLAFAAGDPVMSLPYRGHNPWVKIPGDMETLLPRRMDHLAVKYLVLTAPPDGLKEEHFGPFVASLSRRRRFDFAHRPEPAEGNPGTAFREVFQCPDGVVYELLAPLRQAQGGERSRTAADPGSNTLPPGSSSSTSQRNDS